MSKPEDYGSTIAGSRWFKGEPSTVTVEVKTVRVRWMCPMDACGGEMKFNGVTWPTGNPGYHHSCDRCDFTAAIEGHTYPEIQYREVV